MAHPKVSLTLSKSQNILNFIDLNALANVEYMKLNKESTKYLISLREQVDNKMNEGIKLLESRPYEYSKILKKIYDLD